jgi:acetolactate synthase-1/2/3 large subunit
VHAADAYSRSSEKVGVVLVTSGPGVTNAVTGIATAYMDSIPMVIISGQVPTHAIGQDAFQEVRHGRHHASLRQAQLPGEGRQGHRGTIKKAFYIATTGRPGPVLVDIPKDITIANANSSTRNGFDAFVQPGRQGSSGQIKKAVAAAAGSQAPHDLHGRRRRAGEASPSS